MLRVALSTTKEKDRAFDIQFNSYTRQSDRSQREGELIICVFLRGESACKRNLVAIDRAVIEFHVESKAERGCVPKTASNE
jgi:hypothetical protein